MVIGRTALLVIGGGAMLGAIAIACLSFVRARPTPGRLASAAAAVIVALLAIGADRLMFSSIEDDAAHASLPPWHEVEAFEPTEANGDWAVEPHALVTAERVVPFRGDPVAMSDDDALIALFGSLCAENSPMWHPGPRAMMYGEEEETDPPEWLLDDEDPDLGGIGDRGREQIDELELRTERSLGLALDARLNASALRRLVTLLIAARIDLVTFISLYPERISEEARAQFAQAPLIEALAAGRLTSSWVMLEHVLPEGYADRDRTLWHGEVNGNSLRIQHRAGAPVEDGRYPDAGLELRTDRPLPEQLLPMLPLDDVVYLTLGDPVNPRVLHQAAFAVERLHGRPVLMLGEAPGPPER